MDCNHGGLEKASKGQGWGKSPWRHKHLSMELGVCRGNHGVGEDQGFYLLPFQGQWFWVHMGGGEIDPSLLPLLTWQGTGLGAWATFLLTASSSRALVSALLWSTMGLEGDQRPLPHCFVLSCSLVLSNAAMSPLGLPIWGKYLLSLCLSLSSAIMLINHTFQWCKLSKETAM